MYIHAYIDTYTRKQQTHTHACIQTYIHVYTQPHNHALNMLAQDVVGGCLEVTRPFHKEANSAKPQNRRALALVPSASGRYSGLWKHDLQNGQGTEAKGSNDVQMFPASCSEPCGEGRVN